MSPQKLSTAWQEEHARLVHHVCKQSADRKGRGISLNCSFKLFSRIYNGRAFTSDPSRRMAASEKTLWRYWHRWCHGGRNVEAVHLRYRPASKPRVTADLLTAFVRICGEPEIRSLLAAYRKLQREWPAPLPVSYSTLCRFVGRKKLNQLRAYHRAAAESQAALARAKAQAETEVLLRLPQHPRTAAA